MRNMKTVRPGRANIIHIETELGIFNVYVGLRDRFGRRVERVGIIPNRYSGEPYVKRTRDGRLIELKRRAI